MDPTSNPFAPGAGTQPPELAGRAPILDGARFILKRVAAGRPAKSQILLGLRGVGKTVLLNRIVDEAEADGFHTVVLEAPDDHRFVQLLVPRLRQLLQKLSRVERAKDVAVQALGSLRAFAQMFKITLADVELGVKPVWGKADSGVLEADLPELLLAVAAAAKQGGTAIAMFVDEVQFLAEDELSALITALHHLTQKGMPFVVFGAGLPQLASIATEAKSYAERLFDYPDIGALSKEAARGAIVEPLRREGVEIDERAVALIVEKTGGYPYFLQEWGAQTWNTATLSPIGVLDVEDATAKVMDALDRGFFKVRLDRLSPREKEYVGAMAALGPGAHRSGAVAEELGVDVRAIAPIRASLIKKGMVYSPQYGDTAFTVPLFDDFLARLAPRKTARRARPLGKKRVAKKPAATRPTTRPATRPATKGAKKKRK